MLSDCVIAIHTFPGGREAELLELLAANWDTVKSAYGGSCAPYKTLKRLQATLLRLGISGSIVTAGSASVSDENGKPYRAADTAIAEDLRSGDGLASFCGSLILSSGPKPTFSAVALSPSTDRRAVGPQAQFKPKLAPE